MGFVPDGHPIAMTQQEVARRKDPLASGPFYDSKAN